MHDPELGGVVAVNQTAFAKKVVEANARLLDAIALIGGNRVGEIKAAKVAVADALLYAATDEEMILANSLLATILKLEAKGLDR